jgi:hypothetical protein
MDRANKQVSLSWSVVVTMLLVLGVGCGSSSNHNLTQAQAQAISQEFSTALRGALSSAIPVDSSAQRGARPSLATVFREARPDQLSGCTQSANGETCNLPVSYSGACPGGGTIGVSGDFNFTLDNSGDGSDNTTLTILPTNCSVSNLTINGDPNVTVATQINFTNNAPVFPITATEAGGISYGPNPSGSCSLSVRYTINSQSCTVSGMVCGQSVSGSC